MSPALAMEEQTLPNDELPPVLLQLSDGIGGWHTASGPARQNESRDDTMVVPFSTWPNTTKVLSFRACVPGQPPELFTLPNPFRAKTSTAGIAMPLPQSVVDPDFALEVKSATLRPIPELGELISIETAFTSRFGEPEPGLSFWHEPIYIDQDASLLNEWGQEAKLTGESQSQKENLGTASSCLRMEERFAIAF